MKIFKRPETPPLIADRLVIDAAELHAMKVYGAMRGVRFWFDNRSRHIPRDGYAAQRRRQAYDIAQAREALKEPAPASRPLLRLEPWQLERYANFAEMSNAELGRRISQQTALVKILSAHDDRYSGAHDCLVELQAEAGKRFVGLFYPPLACLTAA